MTHASLFSGIGGPEVAAAMLGWENAFHCEINPFGRQVLDYWFPNSVSYEDITKTDFTEWRGRIDVLTGGFPCQPFSYAGKRGGAEDERYLWPEMLRAIDEIRPTWVVGENVAGLRTMVEGGILTEVGSGSTLFEEDNEFYGYELEQTFTIERICRDLERLGYSVQPMLIPAAAVGAPHRRDRIFILAHDADPDRRDDLRGAGANERESVCEGVQERHEVRKPGIASQVRPAIRRAATDTSRGRCPAQEQGGIPQGIGRDGDVLAAERGLAPQRADGLPTIQRNAPDTEGGLCDGRVAGCTGNHKQSESESGNNRCETAPDPDRRDREGECEMERELPGWHRLDCDGGEWAAADTKCTRLEHGVDCGAKEKVPGEKEERRENSISFKVQCAEANGLRGETTDSVRERLEGEDKSRPSEGGERMHIRRDFAGYDRPDLLPGVRWADFPTISPVHRGNDGLPFNVDDLSIPFSKWRTESLKAYGNAIVPQVMYQIFKAIETI